eukprot:scaffold36217_cov41-Phaeocystis_antarctica.AAC.1
MSCRKLIACDYVQRVCGMVDRHRVGRRGMGRRPWRAGLARARRTAAPPWPRCRQNLLPCRKANPK